MQDVDEVEDGGYAIKVGSRLRAIRRQKRLSLQDVEAASEQEFKASVLGAYERGERAISVPRLQRLARFYRVPVDRLLPDDEADGDVVIDLDRPNGRGDEKVALDLAAIDELEIPEARTVNRYVRLIQVQRGDFNGRVLTIRRDDLRAIAAILDVNPDHVVARLDDLGLIFRPAAAPVSVTAG